MSGLLGSAHPGLEWLPGETLFSLASRYHLMAGNRTPDQTCLQLFGHRRTGSAHDIPAHVEFLSSHSAGLLGQARDIILARSLVPFYFPFYAEQRCENWLAQMSQGPAPNLKAELGLAATRFGGAHPLKACPECMEVDIQAYGVAFWHAEHQLPGVLVCAAHRGPLLVSAEKVSGQNRFGWVLPTHACLRPLSSRLYGRELQFAVCARALWRLPISFMFSAQRLGTLYRQRLVKLDLANEAGARIHHARFNSAVNEMFFATGLEEVFPLLAPADGRSAIAPRLLRLCIGSSARESHHPLNHMLLILLFFGSWTCFWEAYRRCRVASEGTVDREPQGAGTSPLHQSAADARRAVLVCQVQGGKSVTHAAANLGVSTGTAMAWIAATGMHPSRRPKVLRAEIRDRLLKLLQRGTDKAAAAQAVGVSVQTITRILFTEPGLHERWRQARQLRSQAKARLAWECVIDAFPQSTSKEWRRLEPSVYAWLYRNDREWLAATIERRVRPVHQVVSRIDWSARDKALAQAVREAALQWVQSYPRKRPTVATLCTVIPSLRAKLSALGKLPQTRAALLEVSAARRSRAPNSQLALDAGGDLVGIPD